MFKKILIPAIVIVFAFVQCKREPIAVNPQITNLSDYESNDGKISTNITGGKAPYQITWSDGSTDTVLKDLKAGTYYITVVDAKNRSAIDTIEITQPPYPVCIDVEGNNYKTAIIGQQIWMIENLRVKKSSSGIEIQVYAYADSTASADTIGYLYTWAQAMADSLNEQAQGICPDGWHIPSDKEWTTLTDQVAADGKELNELFEPQFAGFYNNGFNNLGLSASYWSSTRSGNNAWKIYFHKDLTKVFRYHENKNIAISVRCIKDEKKN